MDPQRDGAAAVFTSASHPLAVAWLSREGRPDAGGVGFCMLPGRRKAKRTHGREARPLQADIASINQDRLCLVTLCTEEELARGDSPGFRRGSRPRSRAGNTSRSGQARSQQHPSL